MEAPKNWLKMIENIRLVRQKYPAPVDSMGCDQTHYNQEKPRDQRFLVLVSLMLSSQTKDPITWAAVQKLKQNGLGLPEKLIDAKEKDIEDLIHPVGFYRRKAIYLKKVCQILMTKYEGDIPKGIEELCQLPGVGPKMAHLCMQEAWNITTGIGVDTHVHRIAARLGWVGGAGKKIKTPEDTRKALEQWLPYEYWREINHMLVGLGQTICTPLRPKCSECANNNLCPSSSVKGNSSCNSGSITTTTTTTTKNNDVDGATSTSNNNNNNNDANNNNGPRKRQRTKGAAPAPRPRPTASAPYVEMPKFAVGAAETAVAAASTTKTNSRTHTRSTRNSNKLPLKVEV